MRPGSSGTVFTPQEQRDIEDAARLALATSDLSPLRAVLETVDARRFVAETGWLRSQAMSAIKRRYRDIATESASILFPDAVVSGKCPGRYVSGVGSCSRNATRLTPAVVKGQGRQFGVLAVCFQHVDVHLEAASYYLLNEDLRAAGLRDAYYMDNNPLDRLVAFAREHGADISPRDAQWTERGL